MSGACEAGRSQHPGVSTALLASALPCWLTEAVQGVRHGCRCSRWCCGLLWGPWEVPAAADQYRKNRTHTRTTLEGQNPQQARQNPQEMKVEGCTMWVLHFQLKVGVGSAFSSLLSRVFSHCFDHPRM